MTNEEKKAILKQYIGLEKRIARMLDEKKKWKEKAEAISPVYSDMPKAGGCDKIQNAVCQIVDLEIDAQIDLRRRIKAAVKQMDDEKLRDVMMYRYIDGLKLEEIAIEMSYSYMQIYRLHKKAISEIML